MQCGFKAGPKNWDEAVRLVEEDGADMCEVWFRIDRADEYPEMLSWLAQRGVTIGLHHWGTVPPSHEASGGKEMQFKTNLATRDEHIRNTTLQQIKDTIDIASEVGAVYVNAHPGAQHIEKIDLDTLTMELVENQHTPAEQSHRLMLEAGAELTAYARERGTLFTLETIVAAQCASQADRTDIYLAGTPGLEDMRNAAAAGIPIANDISHTATHPARDTSLSDEDHRRHMWRETLAFTRDVAEDTQLLHVNTITPPLNGTDSHDGITDTDFAGDVFPTRAQMVEFLSLFCSHDEVYAVVEPKLGTMHENYRALLQLTQEACPPPSPAE